MYDFLEAVITRQTSPEEAYRKLDEMATKQTETLRKLTKQVTEKSLKVLHFKGLRHIHFHKSNTMVLSFGMHAKYVNWGCL